MCQGNAGLEVRGAHVCFVQDALEGVHARGEAVQNAGVLVHDPVQLGLVQVQDRVDVELQQESGGPADHAGDGTGDALEAGLLLGLLDVVDDVLRGLLHGPLKLFEDIVVQLDESFRSDRVQLVDGPRGHSMACCWPVGMHASCAKAVFASLEKPTK
ncbi:hypothetical protein LE181_01730 [Streptomyces sp. SCA3-4]|uniref:hypothetical protein n=1 Tax=Streptomyces sichuanensis TaxID=2871810 RepID=UPI001CE23645|nr:hypothetical protein [Streptomyces sichuanensis]MCA6090901.1 hypothetical protein [Streptomyces sichuanensis]